MSEKDWILYAIQDLQELANQHSLKDVANALAHVLRVAITEVEADEDRRLAALAEQRQRSIGNLVIFPYDRSARNERHFLR